MNNLDPETIQPTEYRVLVKLDAVEEKTKGGIVLPGEVKNRRQMAQISATLLKVGGNAFENWQAPVPKPGDRVLIAKYSGERPPLEEDQVYALCNDRDVVAVLA
jgi:chaperonin GroES